ncbi:MAG TPA: hypothetical protein HA292_04440 [Candidatus Nitrosotenuis sp.]|nr:hypothetical protein [Candidatus Nitrosotenuis sp.]HIH46315.1 hypothetical protein [Candidatus Nitrosotenuis sp.]HIH68279.1 hypothetical protein [Candidatus Nitrosotenuis sp.]HII03530.1 hypothetical protein [Candidatus Nitrosotenuis sp.]
MSLSTYDGYACVPYVHDHKSIEVKDSWAESKSVESMYFVTATFSDDSKPYFPSHANHYLLAKFNDYKITSDMEKYVTEKTGFVFTANNEIFERDVDGLMNFVSVYYLEYSKSDEDISDLATVVSKNDQVRKVTTGNLMAYSAQPPKFTFPYGDNIVVLEVSSKKSHQSVNKYCEQTRRNVCRKGITMNSLVGLSILEKLK